MIRRSVNLKILNPQYAFLEADYDNSSLSRVQLKSDSNSLQNVEQSTVVASSLKNTIIGLLLKVNPMNQILVWVPADIYCIVFLMTGEMLTF
ncbi:hypothetical protein [Ureibacillus sp. GCM10028918]|uniref:hypothetical protein n=1 Tax=Ureibacillus sp. GCM10028918 TaxID=3273429 RepID=UPI0036F22A31